MWRNPNHPQPVTQPPEPSGQLLAAFERPGRGRGPDAELRVVLDTYQGHEYISLRVWTKSSDGGWYPSKKGVSVRLGEAENLAEVLAEAVRLANFAADQAAKGSPRRDHRRQGSDPQRSRTQTQRPMQASGRAGEPPQSR